MPRRKTAGSASARLADAEQAPESGINIDNLLKELEPFIPGMIKTIGLAAQPKGEGDQQLPGDVKAAAIGLELLLKNLSGRASGKAADVLAQLAKLRQAGQE